MKFLTALCLALSQVCLLSAQQEFAPVGAFWNYYLAAHNGGGSGTVTITVTGDTIVQGQLKKKLQRAVNFHGNNFPVGGCTSHSSITGIGYLHIRNDSVFYNDAYQYQFNYSIGDSFTVSIEGNDYLNVVKDTATVTVGTDTLTRFDIDIICWHDGEVETYSIVERIGPVSLPLLVTDWIPDQCILLAGCADSGKLEQPKNQNQKLITSNQSY